MPRLRVLHLIAHDKSLDNEHVPTVHFKDLLPILPAGYMKEISLRAVLVPWNSPLFQGLSSLSLEDIEYSHRPTISELLAILAASPNLRDLRLREIGPRPSQKTNDKVSLLQLKDLYISSIDYGILVALLDSLAIPGSIGWIIDDVTDPFVETDSFPSMLLDRKTPCRELNITIDNSSTTLEPQFDSSSPKEPHTLFKMDDLHALDVPLGFVPFFQSLRTFFKHAFFNSVTRLTFDLVYLEASDKIRSLAPAAWEHLFATLPKVEALEVHLSGEKNTRLEKNIITALAGTENNPGNAYPELKSINFGHGAFSTGRGREAFEKLLFELVLRRLNIKHLRKLTFNECDGVGSKELQQMKELGVAEDISVESKSVEYY